ncbi:hypothetical protein PT974_07955 [Cladobotryum mycophilum]|uniref:DUF676 domain-containing protein n=1 Tax=Cladobotryum mycophilum TaxID=491253 RepID=A0ABR0SC04_9HYPO
MPETLAGRLRSAQSALKIVLVLSTTRGLMRWYPPAMRSWVKWMAMLVIFIISSILHRMSARIRRRNAKTRKVGLQILSEPEKPNLEIIAVHGLGADPGYTWISKPSAKTDNAQRIHLLKDLLIPDFPNARIISYSYNSDWLVDAPEKTFHDIAIQLKEQLESSRSSLHLPIIFIGHSFGGIIIKETLVQCQADPSPAAQSILEDTCGIIFLGTPHHGASLSTLAMMAANLTRFLGSNDSLVLPLRYHNSQLWKLERNFKLCQEEQVVDQISATGNADKEILIDTDHSGLNKCSSRDDQLYKCLKNTINDLQCPTPLELADKLINDFYSTEDRLNIERLSGHSLPM